MNLFCNCRWHGKGLLRLDAVVHRLRELLPATFEELQTDFACQSPARKEIVARGKTIAHYAYHLQIPGQLAETSPSPGYCLAKSVMWWEPVVAVAVTRGDRNLQIGRSGGRSRSDLMTCHDLRRHFLSISSACLDFCFAARFSTLSSASPCTHTAVGLE